MRRALAGLAAALLACGPTPEARTTWTGRDFLAQVHQAELDFGGLGHVGGPGTPSALAVLEGEPIPFRSPPFAPAAVLQASGPGLPVQPAYAGGAPAGFVVTEVWDNDLIPWMQPVYLAPGSAPGSVARVVFPVDVGGSFYSPFWTAETLAVPAGTDPASLPTSATAVLDTGWPMTASVLVYCSLVPAGLTTAAAAADPAGANGAPRLVHPFTGEALTDGPTPNVGWVDGHRVHYLALGTGNAPFSGQRPQAAAMYFFAQDGTAGDRRLLPLPPVLPEAPEAHALVQRVDVLLPAGAAAFVPAGQRAGLQDAFAAPGFADVPLALDVDPAIDAATARKYLLRVALNPECFRAGAGFPAGCTWLDSAARVQALVPGPSVQPQPVYLAVKAARGTP